MIPRSVLVCIFTRIVCIYNNRPRFSDTRRFRICDTNGRDTCKGTWNWTLYVSKHVRIMYLLIGSSVACYRMSSGLVILPCKSEKWYFHYFSFHRVYSLARKVTSKFARHFFLTGKISFFTCVLSSTILWQSIGILERWSME